MKWIIVPGLWVAAVVVALAVLWRIGRGRNIVLRDRFSPKFVRMVVVVLVVLGAGADQASADPPGRASPSDRSRLNTRERDETVPDVLNQILNQRTIVRWRYFSMPASSWMETKRALLILETLAEKPNEQDQAALDNAVRRLPDKLREIAAAEVEAVKGGRPKPTVTAEQIGGALAQLENGGCFDHWAMAYLWRKTAQLPDRRDDRKVVELFAALHRHARLANTMIRANALVKPPVYRPWRSKAGPPPGYRRAESDIVANLLKSAVRVYPSTDSGTWQREATAVFAIDKDSAPATLIRAGERRPLLPGTTVRLNRLDLIATPPGKAPVVLEHAWLGPIKLPPGRTVTVWDLPALLPADATDKAQRAAAAALKSDEQAIEQLERVLPLSHPAIRAALRENSDAAGAPRLRTILTLFDDSLVR
ncbi:MAG: hypothetical protein HQ567_31385 [Candidatus Nealsonbacteria bacterium]|nr:hypothetical protein [Candidatus Nealsonbacteria bacterium]